MRPAQLFRPALSAAALTGAVAVMVAGCTRNVGDAVVLEKEHIAAAEPSPTPKPTPTPDASLIRKEGGTDAAKPPPSESPVAEEAQTELAPDEVAVDSYVMKKDVRGTGKDPRAMTHEQWLIKVEMMRDQSHFTIHSDRAHFLKLKPGDRVRVSYKQGKYTGTIWSAQIED